MDSRWVGICGLVRLRCCMAGDLASPGATPRQEVDEGRVRSVGGRGKGDLRLGRDSRRGHYAWEIAGAVVHSLSSFYSWLFASFLFDFP